MMNAKNRVQELLAGLGLPQARAVYTHEESPARDAWTSTLVLSLPDRVPVVGSGTASRKSQADVAAAERVLAALDAERELDPPNWAAVYADAQAGDALLKLAAYLTVDGASPEERSLWLQRHESDAALAGTFDRWFAEGAPELTPYGRGLGEKNKATLVEAVIWRRYGARVLGVGAIEALGELRAALTGG